MLPERNDHGSFVNPLNRYNIVARHVASMKKTSRFRGSKTLRCRRFRRPPPADGLSSLMSLIYRSHHPKR